MKVQTCPLFIYLCHFLCVISPVCYSVPLFSVYLKDRCQSLCWCLYWFYSLSTLFVWPGYPGQLQMLFGVIISLRNGSCTDPFSNTLEMSLLLGFPYIRLSHYFNWSSLCILHLHMDTNKRELVDKEKGLAWHNVFAASLWFCSSNVLVMRSFLISRY